MKKLLLLVSALFLASPVVSAEITSRITDSVQLTVDGPAVQSTRMGSSYSVSGSNIDVTTLGGLAVGSATAPALATDGTYAIDTNGQAFNFTETTTIGDTVVTSQTSQSSGQWSAPNLYSSSTTSSGGTAGTLAGTISATGIPTVTAGGSGTTVIGQRTIELSVFQ